ncbi:exodeoxyribonuclease V subunit alpha [Oleiagrimonas sp. MCCC 1A03011]|uniref:exodeoxyribonuclease V subunit alpha n=1 Tax=Oleiagrimonas sp. MCCC 1A03011 TaxID=1926883 RepID=UPI000DC3920E|nr:exodeoxyribonuclease V subunit alpha [Oleiagrimonas sp. MCCC 1A03011]RAP56253.1 exodeoxyribonuclease V subunit alpha [Oleiagrimonas sp. MCCC 1A03011]
MNPRGDLLDRLQARGVLRPLDIELGRCLLDLEADVPMELGLLAAAASLAVSQGHSCLPLSQLPAVLGEACGDDDALPELPAVEHLQQALQTSRWAAPASDAAVEPLLYDEERVWLGRYFHHEGRVAQVLRRLLSAPAPAVDADALRAALDPFFALGGAEPDRQALAALTGLISPLTVITGGPGTGKTTTVLWLLAAWIGQRRASGQAAPRIHLAAPTGKAAARLSESLRERIDALKVDEDVRQALPTTASTLHRLLGVRRGSTHFRHHAGYPLDTDLVVVDEVSMVDLPLMARLLDALPEGARLVLLGDRDQLASVEAGNVLATVCAAAGEGAVSPARAALVHAVTGAWVNSHADAGRFADAVVELHRSHRFDGDSGLGQVAAMIRAGEGDALCRGLTEATYVDVHLDEGAAQHPPTALVGRHVERFAALAHCDDPREALAMSTRHRVLTALRDGAWGSHTLNEAFERTLRQRAGAEPDALWYPGRLLLVTRNAYGVSLFNGDIGVVLSDAEGVLRAWFPDAEGGVRKLALAALPECESAYAMTIHKSQGSEFEAVDIVLPPHDARVLGRELLYTAVTRARRQVTLVATPGTLRRTVARSTRRFSGLAARLTASSD